MKFIPIIHKVNTVKKLKTVPIEYGIEIDIRIENNSLCLSHDPIIDFNTVCKLDDLLTEFNHRFIVANIKDTGIEMRAIETIVEKTENFFLLDFEIPFLFKKNKSIKKFLSVRYSQFEKIKKNSLILNYVDWLWVDTFEKFPINENNLKILPNVKKCIVSPERWGREEDINKIARFMKLNNLNFELIMTDLDKVDSWIQELN